MSKINILAFDIETLPMIASTFRLFKANIRQESIIENTAIFCASWRMVDQFGNPKSPIQSVTILDDPKRFNKNIYDDEHVVRKLKDALEAADVYLFQNGAAFDLKHFNTRALNHGLSPVSQKQCIDTLKQARKHFRFDSNKLDFMGRFLRQGEKMDTGGMELWDNIIQSKYPPVGKQADKDLTIKSIQYAEKYCRQDVNLLIKVYKQLRPHITLPNFSIYLGKVIACNFCGGQDFKPYGFRYNHSNMYRRYWCNTCDRPFDPPRSRGKHIDAEYADVA